MSHAAAFNPLNAELNPVCHLLALLGARHILHVSGLRVQLAAQYRQFIDNNRHYWITCLSGVEYV